MPRSGSATGTSEQEYLDAIASALGAGLALVDYAQDPDAARKTINAWVSKQTAGRIPSLLGPMDVTGTTRLVLVNAVYLKAGWSIPFPASDTRTRPFTLLDGSQVKVPTMSVFGDSDIPLATGSGWKATELGYLGQPDENGGATPPLAMTLIMPDDLAAFEQGLTAERLASIDAALAKERAAQAEITDCPGQPAGEEICSCYPYGVQLFMPRFGIETRAALLDDLKAMGMRLATTPDADFSGITTSEPFFIGNVIHQANIDVDEKGTEAAAATAVVGATTGGCGPAHPLKTVALHLDHPFLFILRDVQTGAILFMGRVVDPSKRN